MKTQLTAAAILVAASGAAMAADLPLKFPPPPPPPPAPMAWTGPFLGVHAGGAFGKHGHHITGKNLFCFEGTSGMGCNPANWNDSVGGQRSKGAFLGGAQFGYNFQLSQNFMIGGVVDWSWLNRSARTHVIGPDIDAVLGVGGVVARDRAIYSDSFRQSWLATARLRAGVTFDNVYLYATGGLAAGDLKSRSKTSTNRFGVTDPELDAWLVRGAGSSNKTAFGWTAGAGVEFALGYNWSVSGEYLYYSLRNSYNVSYEVNTAFYDPAPGSYRVKVKGDGHIFRFGLNYRFGGRPAPIYAAY